MKSEICESCKYNESNRYCDICTHNLAYDVQNYYESREEVSRTCKNCKHYYKESNWCWVHKKELLFLKECNDYEPKEDNEDGD